MKRNVLFMLSFVIGFILFINAQTHARPPLFKIVAIPDQTITAGDTFSYTVRYDITDPVCFEEILSLKLVEEYRGGIAISSGKIVWTPDNNDVGTHTITVEAKGLAAPGSPCYGGTFTDTETFDLTVNECTNCPPDPIDVPSPISISDLNTLFDQDLGFPPGHPTGDWDYIKGPLNPDSFEGYEWAEDENGDLWVVRAQRVRTLHEQRDMIKSIDFIVAISEGIEKVITESTTITDTTSYTVKVGSNFNVNLGFIHKTFKIGVSVDYTKKLTHSVQHAITTATTYKMSPECAGFKNTAWYRGFRDTVYDTRIDIVPARDYVQECVERFPQLGYAYCLAIHKDKQFEIFWDQKSSEDAELLIPEPLDYAVCRDQKDEEE